MADREKLRDVKSLTITIKPGTNMDEVVALAKSLNERGVCVDNMDFPCVGEWHENKQFCLYAFFEKGFDPRTISSAIIEELAWTERYPK